jgi:two-component system LytT family response regulator
MNKELTAVIVDDEAHCQEALRSLLERKLPDIRLLGTASSLTDGVEAVARHRPDILFLDVEIGDRTGFEVLQALGPDHPHVIFTTAHESYALKAIRFSALDFLLKPIDSDELLTAVSKARHAKRARPDAIGVLSLLSNMFRLRDGLLSVPAPEGAIEVNLGRILYFDHDGERTLLHSEGSAPIPIQATIKECEDLLGEHGFIRARRTTLINVQHARQSQGGALTMSDGVQFPLDPRKEEELRSAMSVLRR